MNKTRLDYLMENGTGEDIEKELKFTVGKTVILKGHKFKEPEITGVKIVKGEIEVTLTEGKEVITNTLGDFLKSFVKMK